MVRTSELCFRKIIDMVMEEELEPGHEMWEGLENPLQYHNEEVT